jgi:hypothetical protein
MAERTEANCKNLKKRAGQYISEQKESNYMVHCKSAGGRDADTYKKVLMHRVQEQRELKQNV